MGDPIISGRQNLQAIENSPYFVQRRNEAQLVYRI